MWRNNEIKTKREDKNKTNRVNKRPNKVADHR